MNATQIFAKYATEFQRQQLPEEVLHHAKRAVIDWYAALFPGVDVAPVPQLESLFEDELGRGQSILGSGRVASARTAALINGTAAHAAEVDDSFRDAMYHPGAATIAAALAIGQAQNSSGLDFLRGVVLGYEVSTRIGVVMGRPHYQYWHNTGTIGTFGAAAAAGGLLRLDHDAFANALATAATFAAGLQQAFRMDSMSKPLHAGRAAEGGVLAAQLAARGVTGSMDVLDGDAGLGKAMSNGPDWSDVGKTLGKDFHITRLTFKNHVGCGHTFAAIDAALELMRAHSLPAEAIKRVHVATYGPALDIACYEDPQTENEARFSLRFVVATALLHERVRLTAYTPDRLADLKMRDLMGRIDVSVDPELDKAFPGRRAARLTIEMMNGQSYTLFQPDRKGDPELPLSDGDLEDKLLELAGPVVGDASARRLVQEIWRLDSLENVADLRIANA